MKDASRTFSGGTLPDWIVAVVPHLAVPADLQAVAEAFVLLQAARHRADYDLTADFTRLEATEFVTLARDSIARWPAVAEDDAARLYLAGLLCWKTLRQR